MKDMILGLDVSTSITGATLLDEQGNVLENFAIDTRKYKNFFDKSYVESVDLLENELTIKKPYAEKIKFNFIDFFKI